MELQKLVSSIMEQVIEADVNSAKEGRASKVPNDTYEDALALAVINAILGKYLEVPEDKNTEHIRVRDSHKEEDQRITKSTNVSKLVQKSVSPSRFNGSTKEQRIDSEETLSSSSWSSSCTSSESSYTTSSNSSLSYSSSEEEQPTSFSSQLSFDPHVELFLSKDLESKDNWILKKSMKSAFPIPVSWTERLNQEKLFLKEMVNLTDDLKQEIEYSKVENECSQCSETENNMTEEDFYNSVFLQDHITKRQGFLKIGEEIGESSTDDIWEEGKLNFPSVKLLATKFQN